MHTSIYFVMLILYFCEFWTFVTYDPNSGIQEIVSQRLSDKWDVVNVYTTWVYPCLFLLWCINLLHKQTVQTIEKGFVYLKL